MTRFSIFIVEDSDLYTYFLNEALKDEGHFNVTSYETAEKCIAALDEQPDVVILDYLLPGTNGLEVLKRIHEKKPKLAVIILTNQPDVQVAGDLMEAGAYEYIEKKDKKAVEKLREAIMSVSRTKKEQQLSVDYFWTKKIKSKTIFIVEDNPAYAKALQAYLKTSFPDVQEVKIFPVGEVALMELNRQDPGIIIMDYFLDTKYYDAETGLQTIQQIKAQKPETNIILLSSQSDIHVATEATKTYHCHYVRKDDEAFNKVENYIKGVW
ncbi:MAG: regulator [Bacteroidetes bacterium]|jgi:DNA-binding NtrC family response regulator|nr:regulator [Bacteroidota bacterium]